MKTFKGLNGKITADEEKVVLTRSTKLDSVFHEAGTITIPIDQIEKVAFSEGGLTNGFIAFVRKGDKQPHSVFSAMKQDNAVIFRLTKNDVARELAEYVKALI